jgi:small subunit ribosomal protein S6
MRAYELMVIFDGDLDDSNAAQASNRVSVSAEEFGASIEKNDWWGRRKFAYEIDHKVEGYYLVLELISENGSFINDLDRALRLADDVVRHKLLRLPDHEAEKRGLIGTAS